MQIGRSAYDEEAVRILLQPAVANFAEVKYLLDGQERMLARCAHLRLGFVLRFLTVGQQRVALTLFIGHILPSQSLCLDLPALTRISRSCPYLGFIAVQQALNDLALVGVTAAE